MPDTESQLHETFQDEAKRLLAQHPEEAAVFDSLWKDEEYRLAWGYLHEKLIEGKGVEGSAAFHDANERFFQAFIV